MIKEIEVRKRYWECGDGKRFDSEKEALSHEYHLIRDEFLRRGRCVISSIDGYKILVINNKEELELFKKCCEAIGHIYSIENKDLEKLFPFMLIELYDDNYYHCFCHIGEYIERLKNTTKSLEDFVLKIKRSVML